VAAKVAFVVFLVMKLSSFDGVNGHVLVRRVTRHLSKVNN